MLATHPLISIRQNADIAEAARFMSDLGIGSLGVLDGEKRFAGIITERDITWFVAQGRDPREATVADIVNDFPVIVDGPVSEDEALARMQDAHVRHLVVEEAGDLRMASIRDVAHPNGPARTTADIMSSPAVACRDTVYFEEAAELLAEHDISGMPVVDENGEVVGVISERDLAHALGSPLVRLAVRRQPHGHSLQPVVDLPREARHVRDLMTSPAMVVGPDTSLSELALRFSGERINRLPVVDDGRLIGVVTRGDVLAAVAGTVRHDHERVADPIILGGNALHPSVLG
jgi:CBS domain-containing protein